MTWPVEGKGDWVVGLIFSGQTADEAERMFDDLSSLSCDCEGDEDRECRNVFGSLRMLPSVHPEPAVEVTYDPAADAGYIYVDDGRVIDGTLDLGHGIVADLDADGYVVGIELLGRLRPDLAQALVGKASRMGSPVSLGGDE